MIRFRSTLVLMLAVMLYAPPARGGEAVDGTWKLSRIRGAREITTDIIKLETKDGKLEATIVATHSGFRHTLKSVSRNGDLLRIVLKGPAGDETFEARLQKNEKALVGSVGNEFLLSPATLTATDATSIELSEASRPLSVAAMEKAEKIGNDLQALRAKFFGTKDKESREAVLKELNEATQAANAELPKLYLEVVNQHGDSPAAIAAAMYLVRNAPGKSDAEQVRKWAAVASRAAAKFGPRLERDTDKQLAIALGKIEDQRDLALSYAQQADKLIDAHVSAGEQLAIVSVLKDLFQKANKADELKVVRARIDILEGLMDKEYLATVPSFKGTPFGGREGKSDRIVLMELFTGAQCPPCVAADVAFDVLTKTYKDSDLVLLQYHVHIPGPDPMTNPDTEERYGYYRKAHAGKFGGVPGAIFNGANLLVGGGPMATGENRYETYRKAINPLLENPSKAKLSAGATVSGDQIAINVDVADLANVGENVRLRVALVEETVRYPGGNKIRFHHHVVRAMPGGAAGIALADKSSKHKLSVDLGQLRTKLGDYLTQFASEKRPFTPDLRPMELGHLRVIAFVQDDETHEVLQATQADVTGNKNGK